MENSLIGVAATSKNPKWESIVSRQSPLYNRPNDMRTEFGRDYTRIIHSTAFRRLKHKTQVFFSPQNDHICTRIEHVNHVESISYTIAKYLGLNTELTKAISLSHDLGHSPFGHQGERILGALAQKEIGEKFWHEQNGIFIVDNIETLENDRGMRENLNLTYGVRDGIVSHCGEIDQNGLKPREEAIDLKEFKYANQFNPYTWEACVVKIADKISYIGRDIEDAISLGIIEKDELAELWKDLNIKDKSGLNNTIIIYRLISDVCENSSVEKGLLFSKEMYTIMKRIKSFNTEKIYHSKRLDTSDKYFELIINEIYQKLSQAYNGKNTPTCLKNLEKYYPVLANSFLSWITCFWDLTDRTNTNLQNKVIYNMDNENDYKKAVITYISGMTDKYAMDTFNEIVSF